MFGKVNSPLNKKMEEIKWGEFEVTSLFEPLSGRRKLTKSDLNETGVIPVYSADSNNNGIVGYTNEQADYIVNSSIPIYLIFGDHTKTMNIATSDFSVMDNVKVLVPTINCIKSILFICTVWKKTIPDLGYARHWSQAKKSILKLPITNEEKVDFDFIRSFISNLENEHIRKLEAYLATTNLKDYTLTSLEQQMLDNYSNIEFEEFDVTKEFKVKNTKNILSRDIIENSGEVPYLCASTSNNSISSYISYDEKYLDEGNCIFIGGKTFVVTYQKKHFYSNDSHNLALYLNIEKYRTKLIQLYLATCINKSLGYKYSWGDSISNTKIQNDKVLLPSKQGQPDYESMEILISAIQKIIIKDVVLYTDRKTK